MVGSTAAHRHRQSSPSAESVSSPRATGPPPAQCRLSGITCDTDFVYADQYIHRAATAVVPPSADSADKYSGSISLYIYIYRASKVDITGSLIILADMHTDYCNRLIDTRQVVVVDRKRYLAGAVTAPPVGVLLTSLDESE